MHPVQQKACNVFAVRCQVFTDFHILFSEEKEATNAKNSTECSRGAEQVPYSGKATKEIHLYPANFQKVAQITFYVRKIHKKLLKHLPQGREFVLLLDDVFNTSC